MMNAGWIGVGVICVMVLWAVGFWFLFLKQDEIADREPW